MSNDKHKPDICYASDIFGKIDFRQAEDLGMRRGVLPLRRGSR